VIVKRIKCGFVQNAVLGELGVEPLECIEILSLVGVIERLAEIEVPQVAARGRMDGKSRARPSTMNWRVARIAYHSPSAIGVLPERGPPTVSPTSFAFTSLRKVNSPVRLKSAPPSSLPSTSTSSL